MLRVHIKKGVLDKSTKASLKWLTHKKVSYVVYDNIDTENHGISFIYLIRLALVLIREYDNLES